MIPRKNNRTLIKLLKKEQNDKKNIETKSNETTSSDVSLILSIFAIVISALGLYFQFFYENHKLLVSVFDCNFKNDSTLSYKLIYHNKGNQYFTILSNSVIFYQDEKEIEKKGIKFSKKNTERVNVVAFEPEILTFGQQIYKEENQYFDFKKILIKEGINLHDTIKMAINIAFIDDTGYQSVKKHYIGWIMLNSSKKIKRWMTQYETIELEATEHYIGNYSIP